MRRQIQEQARTQVGRRVAGAVGTRRLDELERTVASLEEAVPENAALQVPLEAMVDDLERTVAGLVERRRGPAPGGAGGGVGA